MPNFVSKFGPTDRVYIDGQKDIIGQVTRVTFDLAVDFMCPTYQVEWLHNGTNYVHNIDEWRLKLAES